MIRSPWDRVVAWGAATLLAMATLAWSSGTDMFFGSLLLLVVFGWGALGVLGVASFARAARERPGGWLHDWALVWVGCLAAVVGSVAVGVTGAPENARIALRYCPAAPSGRFDDDLGGGLYRYSFD